MTVEDPWSTSPEENAAVAAMYQFAQAAAGLLHDVEEARYTDPSGGFTG